MAVVAIRAVRYDLDRARVVRAQIQPVVGREVGPKLELTREQLLTTARLGAEFVTLREDRWGSRLAPACIRVLRLGGQVYLRCDSNPWPMDDLADIPEY